MWWQLQGRRFLQGTWQFLVQSGDSDGRAGLGLGICCLVLATVQDIKDSIGDVGEDAHSPPRNELLLPSAIFLSTQIKEASKARKWFRHRTI